MSLLYDECLLPLGEHGYFGISLNPGYVEPLPAHLFGYARWYPAAGFPAEDRLALCSRVLDRHLLQITLEDKKRRFPGAVPLVLGQVEWLLGQVSDGYSEMPSSAVPLGDNLVLLLFGGAVGEHVFRLVDIPRNRVVFEQDCVSLLKSLNLQPTVEYLRFGFGFNSNPPLLVAAGSGRFILSNAGTSVVLRLTDGQILREPLPKLDPLSQMVVGGNFLFYRRYDEPSIRSFALCNDEDPKVIPFRHGRSGHVTLAGSSTRDHCALAHDGGTVEILDGAGTLIGAFRPIPSLGRKDQVQIVVSKHAGYLLASRWKEDVVLDIEQGMVAAATVPWRGVELDRFTFEPTPHYRPSVLLTDQVLACLEAGELKEIKLSDLQWSSAMRATKAGRNSKKLMAGFREFLPNWKRPAVALKPTKSRSIGSTYLYGLPHLPSGYDWPEHDGRRMLLLCQIALSDFGGQLGELFRSEGALLFFVAVDQDNELLTNDEFEPVATRVLWVHQLASSSNAAGSGLPAIAVRLSPDRSFLPQADAAIVYTENLDEETWERYRAYVEKHQPDGPTAGHRVGGYPCNVQQNDLEARAEMTLGRSAEASEDTAAASRWRLLLQLDSDDFFMWGTDMGMLHFMIHEDDLVAWDFSRVVALSAGY